MGVVEDGGMRERDYRWRDGREGLQMEGWERGTTDGGMGEREYRWKEQLCRPHPHSTTSQTGACVAGLKICLPVGACMCVCEFA